MVDIQARPAPAHSLLTRNFLVACLINAAMGTLYVWSLFLLPMESLLATPRSSLSLAPALALVFFTLGMAIHDRLLRMLPHAQYALVAFALAGGGHLLFYLSPNYWTLLIGYGLLFGLGSGLGYGLALALVTQLPAHVRSLAIGIVMAAFAISGTVLSSTLASSIRDADPSRSFGVVGATLLLIGLVAAALLLGMRPIGSAAVATRDGGHKPNSVRMLSPQFFQLALIFFLICYVGLMIVSHATGMLAAEGVSDGVVGFAPATFTGGYVLGSFFGGKLVDALSGARALVLANVVAAAGLLILLFPSGVFMLAGTLATGAVFGSSASLMPVLIGERYGVAKIGEIYGKMMISYGLAGLLAPWFSGALYVWFGSYKIPLAVGLVMCLVGVVLGRRMSSAEGLRGKVFE